MSETSPGSGRMPWIAVTVAIGLVCAFQLVWAIRTRDMLDEAKAAAGRTEKAAKDAAALGERLDRIDDTIRKLDGDQSFLVDDIDKLGRKVDALSDSLQKGGYAKDDTPPEPPQLDWTQPELFDRARAAAAQVGITLTADEVRVPCRFVLREGTIEYFAVLKGGKEHETLISLIGNTPKDERRAKDFGARLNNAIQALGFKRGKPVQFTPNGTIQPSGEPVYLFLSWREKGQEVLVRAEDLIWNRVDAKPMEHGLWVYVGSSYVKADDPDKLTFAADLTGEAVSTYSQSADTIIDSTSKYDGDDTVFLVATPRIPEQADDVALVIRRKDREPTRTFPDIPTGGVPPGPPPPGGEKDVKPR